MEDFEEKINQIPTILGCKELIKICEVDSYFKRVIFVLDGMQDIKNHLKNLK